VVKNGDSGIIGHQSQVVAEIATQTTCKPPIRSRFLALNIRSNLG